MLNRLERGLKPILQVDLGLKNTTTWMHETRQHRQDNIKWLLGLVCSVRFGVSIYEAYVSGTTEQNLTSLSLFSHLTLQVF